MIVLNAAFAFVQALHAERATEALQRMLPPKVRVRRAVQAVEIGRRGFIRIVVLGVF